MQVGERRNNPEKKGCPGGCDQTMATSFLHIIFCWVKIRWHTKNQTLENARATSSARGIFFKLWKLFTNITAIVSGKTAEIHLKQSNMSY